MTTDGQQVHRVEHSGAELGIVVVDSSIDGRARGGLRIVPQVTELELRAAARGMTLKYGLLGLPQGGAKAGIHGDPEAPAEERRARMLAFARAIEPLLRARGYVPDADIGTRADDIRWTMQALGLRVGAHDWKANRSGQYTAASCVAAARAALAHRGATLRDCRVAIEGFGSVGAAVADGLRREGARVVAVSTSRGALYAPQGLDVDRLLELAGRVGSRLVESYATAERLRCHELLELPVDLLCPCARHHSIHAGNASAIAAPLIAPGANNPASPEAEELLVARGVLYVPDFVSNCGGVLGGTLEFAGVQPTRIASIVDRYVGESVGALVALADRRHVSLRAVAEPLALARHRSLRRATERPTVASRIAGAALELYRRGWMPRRAVAMIAPRHIVRGAVRIPTPHAESAPGVDWNLEWDRAWKANPANPWFHYQSAAYVRWVEARLATTSDGRPVRLLKTDTFEEACGFRPLERLLGLGSSVLMDVSPRILARAVDTMHTNGHGVFACATDVRRLALRPGAFDVILSPSTLDHFSDEGDIVTSLGELYETLRPGGHLLITLDNPANPVLGVRRAVHGLVGPLGGLIPFPMGRTLSRARLVAALDAVGFDVLDSGYVAHAPRVIGLWLGEWAARRGTAAGASRLERWLVRCDRALALPGLRRLSAQFVVAHARRPQ